MDKPVIFALVLKEAIDHNAFEYLLSLTTKERQEYISRFRFKRDKDMALIGDMLAKYAILLLFGEKDIQVSRGDRGKPYVRNRQGIFFNVSHSHGCVVCAVYDKPVGIDVEKIRDINWESIAQHAFTKRELEFLYLKPEEDRQRYFYEIWTAKESFLKLKGGGIFDMHEDIEDNCILINMNQIEGYVGSCCIYN